MEKYSIDDHTHRYACWAAARAVSISRFSNSEIATILQKANLKDAPALLKASPITYEGYKSWFVEQTVTIQNLMQEYVRSRKNPIFRNVSFGIAAKLVSIYIKTTEVIPSGGRSDISRVAIPPIDSFLLKGLNKKTKAWSKLEKEEYMALVDELREDCKNQPFWKLEFYWDINQN